MRHKKNKTIIILGVARSGTSLLAGILHCLGIDMNPDNNPSIDYPFGSFEDREMTNLTESAKKSLHSCGEYSEGNKNDVQTLIKVRQKNNHNWGWKSAKNVYCMDLFIPYCQNIHIITIHRDTSELILKEWCDYIEINDDQFDEFTPHMKNILANEDLINKEMNKRDVPQFSVMHSRIKNDIYGAARSIAKFLSISFGVKKQKLIKNLLVGEDDKEIVYDKVIKLMGEHDITAPETLKYL